MTDPAPRSTESVTPKRTSAATAAAVAANRRRKAERLAVELSARTWLLTDEYLATLTGVLVAACRMRDVEVPDLLGDE